MEAEAKPLKVTVTGAAGRIAYCLYDRLCSGLIFGSSRVELTLFDIPPCEHVLKGLVLELKDGGYE